MLRTVIALVAISLAPACTGAPDKEPLLRPTTVRIISPDHPDATKRLPSSPQAGLGKLQEPEHQEQAVRQELGSWGVKYKGMNVLTTIWRKGTDDYSIEQVVVWRGNGDRVNEELAFRNNRYYMPSGMYYKIRYNRLDAYDSDGSFFWSAKPLD